MSNPQNLIRPPVLNNVNPSNAAPAVEGNVENDNDRIARICAQQCELAIRRFLDPNSDVGGEDQGIEERFRNNLGDLDKVPDVVRSLREFSGNPSEYSSWKKSIDRILAIYESMKGTPKYFAILNTIRNKIVGAADAALESYNTPLNWECIAKCLSMHYADKRDLTTLEYQMSTLVQGNNKIQDFYQEVYSYLSLITNKLSCMDIGREARDLLAQTYRDKALDVFIRGLKGNLSIHLGMKEPKDLPQALHLCLKMENQFVRSQFVNSNKSNNTRTLTQPPSRVQYSHQDRNQRNFYPQLAHMPQISNHQQFRPAFPMRNFNNYNQVPQVQKYSNQNFGPPKPNTSKPQPRPEPMDVDSSVRSRAVNYINRPVPNNNFFGKRPIADSEQFRNPPKIQRNFHLQTQGNSNFNDQYYEEHLSNYENEEELPAFDEYLQNQPDTPEDQNQSETQELVDIHFLDQ